MIWADRAAIVWFIFLMGGLWVLFTFGYGPGGLFRYLIDPNNFGPWITFFGSVVVAPWLFLRLLDWATGGPARRRGKVRATIILP